MRLPKSILGRLTLIIVFLLTGCARGETTPEPQAILTAAAETANAKLTELALATPLPTNTPIPTPTDTPTPTETLPPPTTVAPTLPTRITAAERVEFVADVTIPDGTVFAPNQAFIKTWRLRNAGTATWTTAYSLVFFSGERMGAPSAVPLPSNVPPNATVDVSVPMVSPSTPGQYIGYYMLRNPQGKNFGLGPNADQAFYVWINVAANGTVLASPTPTGFTPTSGTPTLGTPTATSTPTNTAVPGAVGNPSISVNTNSYTGSCPYTFVFPIQFTVYQPTAVTFRLEAGSGTPGVMLVLPPERTENLQPGVYSNQFELTITSSMSGWARLRILAPVDLSSQIVNFELTCQ
ncbi:MAG: NBR1-Ig-like domain-containing protein [Anaerolineales bacterium]|nr:NBR1-Ig-like domain-containing protein [Anaerolineales bacterium]MDW8161404.1 NBR1-Ig-like domain-containing protein [Anaerolineales bacterium]